MKEFVEKLISKLKAGVDKECVSSVPKIRLCDAISIVNQLAEEMGVSKMENTNNGWISVKDRFPKSENGQKWVSCIVSVIRSHYPTSTYDVCDSPYDEEIVMHAHYDVSQKIWHLECDEQVNALMDIEDAPLNCDYVIAWQQLPEPYQKGSDV